MSKENIVRAVKVCGGQVALAAAIRRVRPQSKVTQSHVWKWLNQVVGATPPAEWALPIAEAVGWQVTPHELRPDLYPNPTDAVPAGVSSGETCSPSPRGFREASPGSLPPPVV